MLTEEYPLLRSSDEMKGFLTLAAEIDGKVNTKSFLCGLSSYFLANLDHINEMYHTRLYRSDRMEGNGKIS